MAFGSVLAPRFGYKAMGYGVLLGERGEGGGSTYLSLVTPGCQELWYGMFHALELLLIPLPPHKDDGDAACG